MAVYNGFHKNIKQQNLFSLLINIDNKNKYFLSTIEGSLKTMAKTAENSVLSSQKYISF